MKDATKPHSVKFTWEDFRFGPPTKDDVFETCLKTLTVCNETSIDAKNLAVRWDMWNTIVWRKIPGTEARWQAIFWPCVFPHTRRELGMRQPSLDKIDENLITTSPQGSKPRQPPGQSESQ